MAISLSGKDMVLNAMKNKMKIESLINHYKQFGFLKTLKRILERVGFKLYDRSILLWKLELDSLPSTIEVPYKITVAKKEDIQNDPDYYDGWFTKEEALNRLGKGYLLFLIRDKEKMICCEWVELKTINIVYYDLLFRVPDDMAYFTGRYTVPELRGKGIASQLEAGIIQLLKKGNYKYLFGITDITNTAAIVMSRKNGWNDYQLVNYRRYWFIKYYNVKKSNSNEHRKYIAIFRSPEMIWKTYF